MMKYTCAFAFAFVFLWHLCQGKNVRSELIEGLGKLTQENFTFEESIKVPSEEMDENACECKGVFAKELKHLLGHVEGKNHNAKTVLRKLKANAKNLPTYQNANISCPMKEKQMPALKSQPVCSQYVDFLKILNENDC